MDWAIELRASRMALAVSLENRFRIPALSFLAVLDTALFSATFKRSIQEQSQSNAVPAPRSQQSSRSYLSDRRKQISEI